MPAALVGQTPSLHTFLKFLKQNKIEASIELFISLLRRRQIRNPRACAIGTAHLLLRVVSSERIRTPQALIRRIRDVGRRLIEGQPREMSVGNIVRRVLGVIREISEEEIDPDEPRRTTLPSGTVDLGSDNMQPDSLTGEHGATALEGFSQKSAIGAQVPQSTSLFGIFQHPGGSSGLGSPPPGVDASTVKPAKALQVDAGAQGKLDIKAEVIEGIKELLDELEQVDNQIAEFALDHIHSNEVILTHTSSQTVQKFLTTAAKKRKFTVIHAEAYPNDHESTHAAIVNGGQKATGDDDDFDERWKPLTAMGIQVILVPDSAVFALMSRINKVVLAPHSVLADGSLLAAAGASVIAQAAKEHHVPVVVLSGVYKVCPVYTIDTSHLIEHGNPSKVIPFEDGDFMEKVDVVNPIYDWVDSGLVNLYITNLGGHAPSNLHRIVDDHYYSEDTDLSVK